MGTQFLGSHYLTAVGLVLITWRASTTHTPTYAQTNRQTWLVSHWFETQLECRKSPASEQRKKIAEFTRADIADRIPEADSQPDTPSHMDCM